MGPIESFYRNIELARQNALALANNLGSAGCLRAAGHLLLATQEILPEIPEEGTILPNLGGEIDMGWTGKMPRPSADDLPIYPNGCDLPMPVAVEVLR